MQTSNPSEKDNMTNNSAFLQVLTLNTRLAVSPATNFVTIRNTSVLYFRSAWLQRKPMEPWATSHRKSFQDRTRLPNPFSRS